MDSILSSLISAIIGGVIVTIMKSRFDKKNQIDISLNQILEDKYRSLLIFMACSLDINKKKYFSLSEQVPVNTAEEYLRQIEEYYYHSVLYSSDDVLRCLKKFIQCPSKEIYIDTAKAMRNDLKRNNTKMKYEDLII